MAATALRRIVNLPVFTTGILFASALFGADYARSVLFTGFPWNLPAHIWARTPFMMDLLPLIGFFGLNLVTILLFTMAGVFFYALMQKHYKSAGFAFLTGLVCVATALWHTPRTQQTPLDNLAAHYQIHMIQANIGQDIKWDPQYVWQNFETYLGMSHDAIGDNKKPAIIIWPETATSSNFLSYPQVSEKFGGFLASLPAGSLLITGFLNSDYNHTPPRHYNSIVVFNTAGDILAKYDKHHLVPFGEFIPFQSFIPIGPVTGFEGFQAGLKPQHIRLDKSYAVNILPLICYEIIFPRHIEKLQGNNIIINATNDAWFGKTAGAYQHFDHALFRAAENKIPVLRLSGNGISAVIDSDGHVRHATRLNRPAKISLTTP